MRHRLLAAGLTAILAVGPVAAVPAQAAPLPAAVSCSGVWVVVDDGTRAPQASCARDGFSTGTKALRSAGFSVTIDNGFILKIGGRPSGKSDPSKAYWSYWHATRQADGSYSDWSYSSLGADAYHPSQGNAEGWRYQSLSEGKVAPRAGAPTAGTTEPTPSPTPTKASPKPTKKATASSTASASGTAKATAKATASTSASPSTAESILTPSAVASTTTANMSAVAAEAPTAEATPPASGSPTGTIAAGIAVIAAAGGLGGWWLVKGRRR
ncbi:hypothetical protein ATK74_2101 [Propionicimonas paludicola]|uniref:LPXTG-motif cell wall-anchored protein n=1 Tax=Propionicimonas paludicola TaxID=185243 RepID=A0A2A9CT37_9ACTN|nr:hypothetical protein [Propionicimonas paludicola]PFG17528.1 hypothetical protein ATK74_2101 [Propionicimonas paludicola]